MASAAARRAGGGDRGIVATVAALAAVVCALLTPAVAAAAWEPPRVVDNQGSGFGATHGPGGVALDVGRTGLATALFSQAVRQSDGSQQEMPFAIRRGPDATRWGAPAAVPTPSGHVDIAPFAALAAAPDGGAFGAFSFTATGSSARNALTTAWPADDAGPSPAAAVLCASASKCAFAQLEVATDAQGRGYEVGATTEIDGEVLFTQTDPATGAWRPAVIVGAGFAPKLAVDAGGDVVVTYVRGESDPAGLSRTNRLFAKRLLSGESAFGPERQISGSNSASGDIDGSDVVLDSAGDATVVFIEEKVPGPNGLAAVVNALRWERASASPGAAKQISADPQAEGEALHVAATVDPQARVTAAWDASSIVAGAVHAARYAGGSWSGPGQVTPQSSSDTYTGPALASDGDGTVTLVAGKIPRPSGSPDLVAYRRPAGGGWSGPVAMGSTAADAGAVNVAGHSYDVAAAPSGPVDLVFGQQVGGVNHLLARRFVEPSASVTVAGSQLTLTASPSSCSPQASVRMAVRSRQLRGLKRRHPRARIARVDFFVDGVRMATRRRRPFAATLGTAGLAAGPHRAKARISLVVRRRGGGRTIRRRIVKTLTKGFTLCAASTQVRPVLSATSIRPARFAVGTRAAFRYTLNEAATVRIRIERATGRRFRRAGMLVRRAHAGPNRAGFRGRIGSRPLARGRYRALLTATDPRGNVSRRRVVSFAIAG